VALVNEIKERISSLVLVDKKPAQELTDPFHGAAERITDTPMPWPRRGHWHPIARDRKPLVFRVLTSASLQRIDPHTSLIKRDFLIRRGPSTGLTKTQFPIY
jgi:hypothetical protein